ncbi:uncharacterized protein LOC129580006 [Sitodiplosis mosellana]|nr:uncharacterized protein LOC129580006 [Sitodiplosis mosellana]
MEQHRLLVTQHINVSTQWATALRQIIISISSESQSDDKNAPAVLPDTDVVQFVDVSSKPIVLDSIPPIPQDPLLNPGPATLPISNQQQSNDNHSDSSANVVQENSENEPKSRFGRFGRILHI